MLRKKRWHDNPFERKRSFSYDSHESNWSTRSFNMRLSYREEKLTRYTARYPEENASLIHRAYRRTKRWLRARDGRARSLACAHERATAAVQLQLCVQAGNAGGGMEAAWWAHSVSSLLLPAFSRSVLPSRALSVLSLSFRLLLNFLSRIRESPMRRSLSLFSVNHPSLLCFSPFRSPYLSSFFPARS